jgi:hypothetical protein
MTQNKTYEEKGKMKKLLKMGLLLLLILSLVRCGNGGTSGTEIDISEIVQAYTNGELAIDYTDAVSFEKALNDGEKVNGKIVQFDVVAYEPDSALGIDCWSGEHLNFISEYELDVNVGDIIVGYVTQEASKSLGSWKIPYEVLEIQAGSVSGESVDADENDAAENDSQVVEDTEDSEDNADDVIDDNNQVKEETKSKSTYNITDTTATMYVASTANVRSEPDKSASKLGTLSQNKEVTVTGIVDNGWYRINYNGNDGFIKSDLLSTEKIVVQETPTTNNDNTGTDESTNNGSSTGSGDSADNGSSTGSGDSTNKGSSTGTSDSANTSDSNGTSASADSGGGTGVTVPSTGDTEGDLVWIPTNGGTKYHSTSSCSNMKDPMQVTKEHAEANGFTPCKRCH